MWGHWGSGEKRQYDGLYKKLRGVLGKWKGSSRTKEQKKNMVTAQAEETLSRWNEHMGKLYMTNKKPKTVDLWI